MASQDTFLRSALSNNPFFSALQFLSQSLQERRDREINEEQRQLENQRAQEQFDLQKRAAKLQEQQMQTQLEQMDILRRSKDFNQRLNIPEAIQSGAIDISPLQQSVNVPTAGNLPPELFGEPTETTSTTVKGVTTPSIATGEDMFISRGQVETALQNQQQAELAKLLPTLLANQERQKDRASREQIAVLQAQARAGDAEANRELRKSLAEMQARASQDLERLRHANDKDLEEFRLENQQKLFAQTMPNMQPLTNNPQQNMAIVDKFDPLTKSAVLGRWENPALIPAEQRQLMVNMLNQNGYVIPDADTTSNYTTTMRSALNIRDKMEKFNELAMKNPTGLFSKQYGGILDFINKNQGTEAAAILDSIQGDLETLRGLKGAKGALSDRDMERLDKSMPSFIKSDVGRKVALDEFEKTLSGYRSSTWGGAIPPEQLNLIDSYSGIDFNPERIQTRDYYNNLFGGN